MDILTNTNFRVFTLVRIEYESDITIKHSISVYDLNFQVTRMTTFIKAKQMNCL